MDNRLEAVLEVFIKNEIKTTEERISAIRTFVDTLRAELVVYSTKNPAETNDKRYFSMVLNLFQNMVGTYDEEVQLLIRKRDKMLEHLLHIRSVATHLIQADTKTYNLHIN